MRTFSGVYNRAEVKTPRGVMVITVEMHSSMGCRLFYVGDVSVPWESRFPCGSLKRARWKFHEMLAEYRATGVFTGKDFQGTVIIPLEGKQ